jgi:lipid-A-disaccharide synthase
VNDRLEKQTGSAGAPTSLRSLFVCVGDLSADQHAGKLIGKLKAELPDLDVWGVGGEAMQAAGARILYDRDDVTAFGIVEVIRHLPRLAAVRRELLKKIVEQKPDAVLLMDFGGFNIGFAQLIRKQLKDIPIIYFISPQVWGSRPWRIKAIAASVTKMLVIFPFEETLYRLKGVDARFVGHPLALKFATAGRIADRREFCAAHALDPARPLIGIFPGSRKQEVRKHAGVVLAAMDWLRKERPELQFVVSQTDQRMADAFQLEMERLGYIGLAGRCFKTAGADENLALLVNADLIWAKSGTTTLEATLAGKPMLIYYNSIWPTYLIFTLFKTVRYVGWPNLLNGDFLVPELIMLDSRAEQLVRYTLDWLDTPGLRQQVCQRLVRLKEHLGEGDFTENAAREILSVIARS